MPGPLKQVVRLSKVARRAPTEALGERLARLRASEDFAPDIDLVPPDSDVESRGKFGLNSRVFRNIMDRSGLLEQRWSDSDFEHILGYADGEGYDMDVMPSLIEKYGMPAPQALLRGDTGMDLPDYGRTTRPLSTTVSPSVAEEFAYVGAGRDVPRGREYDPILNRINSYSIRNEAERARVLPVPVSGQSEFILAPYSRVDLMEALPADEAEDGMVRRLYRLRKKYGGSVKAP